MNKFQSDDIAKTKRPKRLVRDRLLHPRKSFSRMELFSFISVFALVGGLILIRSWAYYDPTALVLYHANGNLVQSNKDASIYLVENGQRHFVSLDAFRSGRFSLNEVRQASTGDEQLAIGDPVILPSGVFVQDRFTNKYYVTDKDSSGNNIRRPIDNVSMFLLGYDPAKAQVTTELPATQGPAITANSAHPDGTKVTTDRFRSASTVYVVNQGQLHPATPDVLKSYKLDKAPLLPASKGDLRLPKGSALNYADGTLVQGSDPSKTYVINNSGGIVAKRLIRTPEVFMALGYDHNNIHKLADTQLPAADGLPLPENSEAPVTVSVNIKPGQDGTQLAKDYKGRSNTVIQSAYKDWVAIRLPVSAIAGLKQDPRVAFTTGSAVATTASIACEDGNGTPVPCPILDSFSASPSSITAGSAATLSWSSRYTDYCTASGGWGGQVGRSGSVSTGALNSTTSYGLVCTGAGGDSGSLGTSVTVTAAPPPTGGTVSNTSQPTISGIAQVGQTLSANPGSWNGSPTSFAYRWQRCDPNGPANQLCSDISTATAQNYVLQNTDSGYYYQVKVTASNGSSTATAVSGPTAVVVVASPPPPPPPPSGSSGPVNTSAPTISGVVSIGSVLSANNGSWTNNPTGFLYRWQRCDPNAPVNSACSDISIATNSTYGVQAGDANYGLRIKVTASNAYGISAPAYSSWTSVVAPSAPTAPPVIQFTGTPAASTTSTSATFSWTITGNVTYVSCRLDSGSNSSCFSPKSLTGLSVGSHTFYVKGSNPSTSATASYQWTVVASNTSPPVNSLPPTFSGTTAVGSTLTATPGSWSGSPTSFAYRWQRCDPNTAANRYCTDISTAASNSYQIQAGDANYQLRVRVTAQNSIGQGIAYSDVTAVIQPGPGGAGSNCDGSNGVYLYSGTSYTGNCQKFTANSASSVTWTVGNDTVSSIKVIGSWTASLYKDANYGGDYSLFSLSHSTLAGSDVGNASTSSLQVSTTAQVVPTASACSGTSTAEGVYLYSVKGFQGVCQYIGGTYNTAESWTMGDNNTQSLRVVGPWSVTLFSNVNLNTPVNQPGVSYAFYSPPSGVTTVSDLSTTPVKYSTSSIFAVRTGNQQQLPTIQVLPTVSGTTSVESTLTSSTGTWSSTTPITQYLYEWDRCSGYFFSEVCKVLVSPAAANTYSPVTADSGYKIRSVVYAYNSSGRSFAASSQVGPITPKTTPPSGTVAVINSFGVASGTSATIQSGQSAKLVWTTTNAASCTGSNGNPNWVKTQPANYPDPGYDTGPITQTTKFSLSCLNSAGTPSAPKDVTITVAPGPTGSALAKKSPGLAAIGWTPGGSTGGRVGVLTASGVDTNLGVNVGTPISCGDANSGRGHDNMVARFIGLSGDGVNTPAGVAPGATIIPLTFNNVLSEGGGTPQMACVIRAAADAGIDLIEISYTLELKLFGDNATFTCGNTSSVDIALAVCYAHDKGSTVIAAAGNNTSDDAGKYAFGSLPYVRAITSANEFNGQPPNSASASAEPKTGCNTVCLPNQPGFVGCVDGTDDFGQSGTAYWDTGTLYAAPLCVWNNLDPIGFGTYPQGVSFATPMAAGVLLRGGSLTGGGEVGKTGGHNFGNEIHL